uniref:Uncharacterized protein n=1 Tax=Rhizophora mucronata TaxID=61149 RepID=A0A2P2MGE5_RHIMU
MSFGSFKSTQYDRHPNAKLLEQYIHFHSVNRKYPGLLQESTTWFSKLGCVRDTTSSSFLL